MVLLCVSVICDLKVNKRITMRLVLRFFFRDFQYFLAWWLNYNLVGMLLVKMMDGQQDINQQILLRSKPDISSV